MALRRLTVVLSQGQSQNPVKRGLEEDIAAALIMEPGIEVSVIPNLYDLDESHTGLLYLRSISGDMVVLSWLYPRAAHWELDRVGVKGHEGTVSLVRPADDDEDEDDDTGDQSTEEEPEKKAILGSINVPDRRLYCIDLRDNESAPLYIDEIRRIALEVRAQTHTLQLCGRQEKRSIEPPG